MKKNLLLIGGGGHCHSVADCINTSFFNDIGVIDNNKQIGDKILSYPIIGSDQDLDALYKRGFNEAIVTIGSTGSSRLRVKLVDMLLNMGFSLVNIVDQTATVSRFAQMGLGNFIGKNAVVNAKSSIGNNVIINTMASVDHDCNIEDFVHIAPGCTLSGKVNVGKFSHLGTGCTVIQGINVGQNSLIGAGSVVVSDIPDNVVAFGNPCKVIKER